MRLSVCCFLLSIVLVAGAAAFQHPTPATIRDSHARDFGAGRVPLITKLTAQEIATGTSAVGKLLPGRRSGVGVDPSRSRFVLRIEDFGGDPTGVVPADNAFHKAVEFAWNAGVRANHTFHAHIPDLGGLQFDLAGGTFLLDQPVVFPASGGANFALKDGTLRASSKFPVGRYLVEANMTAAQWPKQTFEDMAIRNVVFDGAARASGLACTFCNHITVDGCWFYRFTTNGFLAFDGHENYVSNSWFSQCDFDDNTTPLTINGTGVSLQSSDSSIVNSIIFCTKLGILVTAGNSIVQDVHIYNSGHHTYTNPRDPVQKSWWPFGGAWIRSHDTRLTGVYFDDCILTVDNPSNVIVTDGLWLLGAWTTTGGLVLRASDGWDYSSHPRLDGFVVKNNYLTAAPSWKQHASEYARKAFIFVDEIDGHGGALFNVSASSHLDISANIYPVMKEMVLESGFRVQSTSSRQSIKQSDATRWVFDFSRVLLFDQIDYVASTVALLGEPPAVAADATTDTAVGYVTYVNGSTVVVETTRAATALVSVEVMQGRELAGESNLVKRRLVQLKADDTDRSTSSLVAQTTVHEKPPCSVVDISTSTESVFEAQDKARQILTRGTSHCVDVILGSRSFRLREPLVLTTADSGTNWIGRGAEFTTAVELTGSAWQKSSSSEVLTLDVSSLLAPSNYGTLQSSPGAAIPSEYLALLVRTKGKWRPMTIARWPNIPFDDDDMGHAPPVNTTTIKSLGTNCSCPKTLNGACVDMSRCGVGCKSFVWADETDRPLGWVQAAAENRLFIHGSYKYVWRDYHTPVVAVDPTHRMIVANVSISPSGITNDSFWYAYGLHEELDTRGEFVLDEKSHKISAIFPEECVDEHGRMLCPTRLVPAGTACSAGGQCFVGNCSTRAAMVRLIQTHDITLSGLNFSGSVGGGLGVIGSTNISIDRCNINNVLNGLAVQGACTELQDGHCVSQVGSWNVSLTRSSITHTGLESSYWDGGNRSQLTSSGFLVENNVFSLFGQHTYNYNPGVSATGVGTIVRKNEFHSSYHAAILFGGNDHVFELNDFHHVTSIGYDSGTIYTGRDLAARGNVIRYNLFHHLDNPSPCNYATSCLRAAIYIDDGQDSVTVEGNIFFRVMTGFFSNTGSDMRIRNNLFLDVQVAVRQSGSAQPSNNASLLAKFDTLNRYPFRGALWQSRYPELARFKDWMVATQPPSGCLDGPLNNILDTNLAVRFSPPYFWDESACSPVPFHGGDLEHRRWSPGFFGGWSPNDASKTLSLAEPWINSTTHFLLSNNTLMADPGFVSTNPEQSLNFSLKPSSKMWALGWRAIPDDEIGPST